MRPGCRPPGQQPEEARGWPGGRQERPTHGDGWPHGPLLSSLPLFFPCHPYSGHFTLCAPASGTPRWGRLGPGEEGVRQTPAEGDPGHAVAGGARGWDAPRWRSVCLCAVCSSTGWGHLWAGRPWGSCWGCIRLQGSGWVGAQQRHAQEGRSGAGDPQQGGHRTGRCLGRRGPRGEYWPPIRSRAETQPLGHKGQAPGWKECGGQAAEGGSVHGMWERPGLRPPQALVLPAQRLDRGKTARWQGWC